MHIHLGLKHKRVRCKVSENEASHRKKYLHSLDKITFIAGVVGPFMVMPQIYQIFVTHQTAGVSALSWGLMFLVTAPWILYGIAHKDKAIIASFILWEIVNFLVVLGVFLYR